MPVSTTSSRQFLLKYFAGENDLREWRLSTIIQIDLFIDNIRMILFLVRWIAGREAPGNSESARDGLSILHWEEYP